MLVVVGIRYVWVGVGVLRFGGWVVCVGEGGHLVVEGSPLSAPP